MSHLVANDSTNDREKRALLCFHLKVSLLSFRPQIRPTAGGENQRIGQVPRAKAALYSSTKVSY